MARNAARGSTIVFEVGRDPKAMENIVCLAEPWGAFENPEYLQHDAIEYVVGVEACGKGTIMSTFNYKINKIKYRVQPSPMPTPLAPSDVCQPGTYVSKFGTYAISTGSSSGWPEEKETIAPIFTAVEAEMEIFRCFDRFHKHIS